MEIDKVETVVHRFDLVTLGECLVELRREGPGQYTQSYAGDVFNTLYYASRLGLHTGFISQFGDDHFTEGLLDLCRREGIDTSVCKRHQHRPNGIYMIRTNDQGQPAYSFWRSGSAATMTLAENSIRDLTTYILRSKSFLFSAIGLAVFKEIEKLFELLQSIRGKVRIHLDMNVRPALWERMSDLERYLQRLGPLVDVLFISSTDDRHVFGERSGEAALASMMDAGYEQIVYRDGSHPTFGWSAQTGVVAVPTISNVTVVDATGAGDAFNAGFIAASDRSFEESIHIGNICGALAIQERGGQAAHFKREDVLRNI